VVTDEGSCGSGTIAFNLLGTMVYEWFNNSTRGTAIHVGPSFTTPFLNSSNFYYVSIFDVNCSSPRASVNAFILSVLPDSTAANV
jgi:hypothetical protein